MHPARNPAHSARGPIHPTHNPTRPAHSPVHPTSTLYVCPGGMIAPPPTACVTEGHKPEGKHPAPWGTGASPPPREHAAPLLAGVDRHAAPLPLLTETAQLLLTEALDQMEGADAVPAAPLPADEKAPTKVPTALMTAAAEAGELTGAETPEPAEVQQAETVAQASASAPAAAAGNPVPVCAPCWGAQFQRNQSAECSPKFVAGAGHFKNKYRSRLN